MKKRLVAIFLLFTFIVNTSYAEKIIFDAYGRPMKTMSSSNSKLDIPKIEINNVPSTSKLQQNSQQTNTENTVEIKYEVDTVNKPEIITDKKLNNKAETNIQKDNKISQENSVMYQNYPIMTKNMSTRQKKAFIRKYMENLKYADYAIDDIIKNIPWSKVTDDFAPSFYIALDKGYINGYINRSFDIPDYNLILPKYFTNETIMAQVNNLIEYMLAKGYLEWKIYDTIGNILWSETMNNFAPSFYIALDKKYIHEYIYPYYYAKYFTDETVMAKLNNLIERMFAKGYSNDNISFTLDHMYLIELTEDFAPSFYTALDKGYIYKYINPLYCAKYFTNETIMAKINNLIEQMLDKGYSQEDIQTGIKYAITSIACKFRRSVLPNRQI